MGKITHTHSPRTGVESSTTYLRVRICAYSPRTGIRSKCLQNPFTMEPNHLRRLQDTVGFFFFTTTNRQIPTGTIAVGFFFFTTTNQQIPTGTTYTGLIFPDHNIKGLLFPNQKRLGPFPKKAHTPSESGTGPSASSHMDTSHSCRKLNLPDSELMHLGSALPSRVFLS